MMNPDINIREQRHESNAINKIVDNCNPDGTWKKGQLESLAQHASYLSELVQTLDKWIIDGGNLPKRWNRKR